MNMLKKLSQKKWSILTPNKSISHIEKQLNTTISALELLAKDIEAIKKFSLPLIEQKHSDLFKRVDTVETNLASVRHNVNNNNTYFNMEIKKLRQLPDKKDGNKITT